jgi:hypothetical protein
MTDAEREQRIEQLGHLLVLESTLVERARMWREMRDLILHRSAKQVARMEKQKGLR